MNNGKYRNFGVALIVIASITAAGFVFAQLADTGALTRGYGGADYFYDLLVEGIIPGAIAFGAGFFSGLFFYHFGKRPVPAGKLVKTAFYFHAVPLLIMIILALRFTAYGDDPVDEAIMFMIVSVPASIVYVAGMLLLIIHKAKTKHPIALP